MSLIDEALKRARMEAARKAADEQGMPYPTIPRRPPRPRRRLWPAATAVAAALILGLLAGALMVASRAPAAPEPVATARAEPFPAPAAGAPADSGPASPHDRPLPMDATGEASPPQQLAAATATAEPTPQQATPAAAEPPRARPERSQPTAPAAATPAPAAGQFESAPGRERPAAAEPAAGAAPPARPRVMTDPESGVVLVLPPARPGGEPEAGGDSAEPAVESFFGSFEAGGGATIELGGIAWSETGPYALINGRVVGTGDQVEGFTVEWIEQRQVELRSAERLVHLKLP